MVKIKVSEDAKPCAVLFVFFVSELAAIVAEVRAHFIQYIREVLDFLISLIGRGMWSVNKDVPLPRVGVDIQEHFELVPLLSHFLREILFHKMADVLDLGEAHLGLGILVSEEAPVHVLSLSVTSVVASHDAVRIDHG